MIRFKKRAFRPFRRRRGPTPDVIPVQICEQPVTFNLGSSNASQNPCPYYEDLDFPPVREGLILLDGGAFSQLGNATQGMTKGMKFRSLRAQYDFLFDGVINGTTYAQLVTIFHMVVRVQMQVTAAGRVPSWIPNPLSAEDANVGDVLWRGWNRMFIPRGFAGTSIPWVSLAAGTVQSLNGSDSEYSVQSLHQNTFMSIRSRRNLNEAEALMWVIGGWSKRLDTGILNHTGFTLNASLQGRMTVDNWQS